MSSSSTTSQPPAPPLHLFRVIKIIADTAETRTTLCLPRELPLPSPQADASALIASIEATASSHLQPAHIARLPQLVLVHTASSTSTLRKVAAHMSIPRRRAVQITSDAATSWACEVPVFGPTLREFGRSYVAANQGGGVASWFLAHVFVELITLMCDAGIKKMLDVDVVRLDMHRSSVEEDAYVFRAWPLVVVDACAEDAVDGDEVARSVLELIRDVVFGWSDSAPFIKAAGGQVVTTDPFLLVLGEMMGMSLGTKDVSMRGVRDRFVRRLSDVRITGPMLLPRDIAKHVHADLVTDEEMRKALTEPVVIKFERKYDGFLKLAAGKEVNMGSGGFAGMRTGRILVVRFGVRKDNFLRAVGEYVGIDVEAWYPVPQSRR
ncbi:hypothetical protein DE146DRAFT_792830 [Phaeosphaeria sp. MPI-PUGE-AT-0046c]|nr:hypothetical protein DE146DRAFT_792830 [Phaeosphaeria sp. MPI-PUGE-AT-0046c]